MVSDHGFYSPPAFICVVVAWLSALAACLGPDPTVRVPPGIVVMSLAGIALGLMLNIALVPRWSGAPMLPYVFVLAALIALFLHRLRPAAALALAGGIALLFSGVNAVDPWLLYPERAGAVQVLNWAALAGFLLTASLLPALATDGRGGRLLVRFVLVLACGGLIRLAAIWASPNPRIDVIEVLHGAPVYLLEGVNPYRGKYLDPQTGIIEKDGRYPTYPPLPFLLEVPAVAAGVDVRYLLVAADVLAARGAVRGRPGPRRAGVCALAAAIYLFHPGAPFLIEQSWYEPLLAALFGWGLVLAGRNKILGELLLGFGLVAKQYGIVALVPLLAGLPRRGRLLFGVGIAAVCTLLPFLLWDAAAFLRSTVTYQMSLPPRDDGLTITTALFHLTGGRVERRWLQAFAIMVIAAIAVRIGLCRRLPEELTRPSSIGKAALGTAAALLTFFLCHTQGFFNYFYLCQYLFLFAAVTLTPRNCIETKT